MAKFGLALTNFKLKNYDEVYDYLRDFRMFAVDEIGVEYYKKIIEIAEYFESKKDYARAIDLYDRIDPWDYMTYFGAPLRDIISEIYKKHITDFEENTKIRILELNNKLAESEMDSLKSINKARIEERDKILSNLSHSIKNLISTVIDPLTNLHEEKEYKDIVVENALKGADLIREIVNAMNLSYRGSLKDFEYDVQSEKKTRITMESILIESLKHSVSNMFDSKYFGNFMRNYFPDKEVFQKAKTAWAGADSSNSIIEFINEFMFKCNLNISDASKLYIGNEKGSAIKFQILFQEMILNAVKYVSFVDRQERSVAIDFNVNKNKIIFKIKNNYMKEEKTRTTGLGNVIIDNFAKLLKAEKTISKNGSYVITIKFKNIWKDSERKKQ